MPIMYQQITLQLRTGQIVNTASPISHITKHHDFTFWEGGDYIGEETAEEHQALGELQAYAKGISVELFF